MINETKVSYWVIKFDDPDVHDLIYTDEAAARKSFKSHSDAWSCRLFREATDVDAALAEITRIYEEACYDRTQLNKKLAQARLEALEEAATYAQACGDERRTQLDGLTEPRKSWVQCKMSEALRIRDWCRAQAASTPHP